MEALSLLRYWRGGGLAGNNEETIPGTTTISTILQQQQQQPAVEKEGDDVDDGSFFDMEFTVPNNDNGEGGDEQGQGNSSGDEEEEDDSVSSASAGIDGEREFNFTVSSGSSDSRTDPDPSLSPSDDLFFKGRLVPLEPVFNHSEPDSKSQFPVSLLKSATKFRILMLRLKKPKSTRNAVDGANPKQPQEKFFTVKCKVEEVPIVSLFTRENSSRSFGSKLQKQSSEEATTDDKSFSKDVVQKYLKMIKPLYIKVSKRYGGKPKFSGQLSLGSGKTAPAPAPTATPVSSPNPTKNIHGEAEESKLHTNVRSQKQGNLSSGLRVVRKHLVKSRSASSAVAAVPTLPSQGSRRDDSLLQYEDGIQGAILHCKRSFNATRDSEISMLSRCASDPCREKLISSSRNSSDLSHKEPVISSRALSEVLKNA